MDEHVIRAMAKQLYRLAYEMKRGEPEDRRRDYALGFVQSFLSDARGQGALLAEDLDLSHEVEAEVTRSTAGFGVLRKG